MTGPTQDRHDAVVQTLAERYRREGYEVHRDQSVQNASGDVLSADLLATKGPESILVEVRLVTSARTEPKLRMLSQIAHDQGWKFVIAIVNEADFEEVEITPPQDIQKALRDVGTVGETSQPSAVLLAWSALEAAARLYFTRAARRLTKPVQARTLVQQLAAAGAIDVQEEQLLNRFAGQRNRFAHGTWSTDEAIELNRVVEIARRLVDTDPLHAAG